MAESNSAIVLGCCCLPIFEDCSVTSTQKAYLQEIIRYLPVCRKCVIQQFQRATKSTQCTSFRQAPTSASDLDFSFVTMFATVWSSSLDSLVECSDSWLLLTVCSGIRFSKSFSNVSQIPRWFYKILWTFRTWSNVESREQRLFYLAKPIGYYKHTAPIGSRTPTQQIRFLGRAGNRELWAELKNMIFYTVLLNRQKCILTHSLPGRGVSHP